MISQIRATAITINLAQAIYYARAERWDLSVRHWDAAPLDIKRDFIEHAQTLLEKIAPPQQPDLAQHVFDTANMLNRVVYATGLHRPDRVIGSIEPKDGAA